MGAHCCVAAKNKSSPTTVGVEASTNRNIRYSPSWSFRWDNRTHIEDIVDHHVRSSHGNSRKTGPEIKSSVDTETEGISDGGSPSSSFQSSKWQKSPSIGRAAAISSKDDLSIGSNSSFEEKDKMKLSTKSGALNMEYLVSTSSMSPPNADPSSSRSCFLPSDPTTKPHRSPGYQLSRQICDSRMPTLRSLDEKNSTEGRWSFVLPTCSSDLSTGGSNGGSSDWSMRLFSELVASSQRDRLSFDSDNFSFGNGKISGSSSQLLVSPPVDLQRCGICAKLLKERAPWSGHKIGGNEAPVVSVLICGHTYHAECLENVTSEIEKYDPSCPICANGGKSSSKLLSKAELKAKSKISRTAVADIDLDSKSVIENWKVAKGEGKVRKMGVSSSLRSSLSRPFLSRHFSVGSRTPRSTLESESTRKKGFWSRHRKA